MLNHATMTEVPRAKILGVRLTSEEWARFERLREHLAGRYPGVEMTNAAALKILLALAERTELGEVPAAEGSRPRPKKPRK